MSEFAVNFASVYAGLIGLLFFFGFFVFMLIWIFRPGSAQHYAADAHIPFKDDSHA